MTKDLEQHIYWNRFSNNGSFCFVSLWIIPNLRSRALKLPFNKVSFLLSHSCQIISASPMYFFANVTVDWKLMIAETFHTAHAMNITENVNVIMGTWTWVFGSVLCVYSICNTLYTRALRSYVSTSILIRVTRARVQLPVQFSLRTENTLTHPFQFSTTPRTLRTHTHRQRVAHIFIQLCAAYKHKHHRHIGRRQWRLLRQRRRQRAISSQQHYEQYLSTAFPRARATCRTEVRENLRDLRPVQVCQRHEHTSHVLLLAGARENERECAHRARAKLCSCTRHSRHSAFRFARVPAPSARPWSRCGKTTFERTASSSTWRYTTDNMGHRRWAVEKPNQQQQ